MTIELTQMERQQIVHIQELNTRLAEAEVKIADLMAALKKYGKHLDYCSSSAGEDQPCDCGYRNALMRMTGR